MLSTSLGGNTELRPLEPWNAAELLAYTDKHREFLQPWLPWTEVVTDEDGARGFLQRFADRQAADTGRLYGIWDGDDLVGGTMFRVFDTSISRCELGVWLSPDVLGRGLITRAATVMIDWAIKSRGMIRVEWICDNDNAPSQAVAKRLGMTYEGTMRQLYSVGDRRVDAQQWAVLAQDWLRDR